jgi:hypothetical protein
LNLNGEVGKREQYLKAALMYWSSSAVNMVECFTFAEWQAQAVCRMWCKEILTSFLSFWLSNFKVCCNANDNNITLLASSALVRVLKSNN